MSVCCANWSFWEAHLSTATCSALDILKTEDSSRIKIRNGHNLELNLHNCFYFGYIQFIKMLDKRSVELQLDQEDVKGKSGKNLEVQVPYVFHLMAHYVSLMYGSRLTGISRLIKKGGIATYICFHNKQDTYLVMTQCSGHRDSFLHSLPT